MLTQVWKDIDRFVTPGRLRGGARTMVSADVESMDALLQEQSDLTFGPRMQQMEVWQV
jgi:hypothetical protein